MRNKLGDKCMIFAHRGANREAAENTRSAFDKALAHAIDGIETDIQLSHDEVAVLWHDRFLSKLGLLNQHIDDFNIAQLQAMNFASHFSPGISECIVTLQEFIDAYRKRCRLLLEIKNREWELPTRHETKVRKTLASVGPVHNDEIMVSSFNLGSLIFAHQCRPQVPLVYNFEDDRTINDARLILAEHPFLHGLCVPVATLDEGLVKLLRSHHKCVAVYTCNSDDEIRKALHMKVDILISDVPQKALQLRDE